MENQPVLPPSSKKPFDRKLIIFGVAGLLLILAVSLFILKGQIKKKLPALPTPPPKITIPCPADQTFCQNAKEVTKNEKYSGLGANVPPNTPIYAPFDGVLASSRAILFGPDSKIAPFVQIILKANDSTLPQAVYLIHPTAKGGVTKMSFKKGDIIATVSGKLLTYFGDYNLIFALIDKDDLLHKDRTEFIK